MPQHFIFLGELTDRADKENEQKDNLYLPNKCSPASCICNWLIVRGAYHCVDRLNMRDLWKH